MNSKFDAFSVTVFPFEWSDAGLVTKDTGGFTAMVELPKLPYSNEEVLYSSKIFFADPVLPYYCIQFDPLTNTERSYDFVEIRASSAAGVLLYSNSGSSWPSKCLASPGGIVVVFRSDSSEVFWGMRMRVTGAASPADFVPVSSSYPWGSFVVSPFAASGTQLWTTYVDNFAILQTPRHPYINSEALSSSKIDFARPEYQYCLQFDPQTETEDGFDFVEIRASTAHGEVLYSNSGSRWPSECVASPRGIVVVFLSDNSVTFWGMRMRINGLASPGNFVPVNSSYPWGSAAGDSSSQDEQEGVRFIGNRAKSGGALYLDETNKDVFVLPGTLFERNVATAGWDIPGAGGAVNIQMQNKNVYFYSTKFLLNSATTGPGWAGRGGAVSVMLENFVIRFHKAIFEQNAADGYGGAVYLDVNNGDGVIGFDAPSYVGFTQTACIGNTAYEGGCIYGLQLNSLKMENTIMKDNVALGSGGGIAVGQGYLEMVGCELIQNVAGDSGGGVYLTLGSEMVVPTSFEKVTFTAFKGNQAMYGAGVFLNGLSKLHLAGFVSFDSNNATLFGGAIRQTESSLSFRREEYLPNAMPLPFLSESVFFKLLFAVDNNLGLSFAVNSTAQGIPHHLLSCSLCHNLFSCCFIGLAKSLGDLEGLCTACPEGTSAVSEFRILLDEQTPPLLYSTWYDMHASPTTRRSPSSRDQLTSSAPLPIVRRLQEQIQRFCRLSPCRQLALPWMKDSLTWQNSTYSASQIHTYRILFFFLRVKAARIL